MSGPSQDWMLIAAFFGAFFVVTIGEIFLLSSRLKVPMKKALTVVFLPNFATITLGFFVTFIIFGIILAVAWDENTTMPGGNAGTWIAFIGALAFPFLLMTAIRRMLIGGMRIEQIQKPLPYALTSTIIFFALVCGLPAVILALR